MARENIDLLEQKCSKMILDCVDWQEINTTKAVQDVGNSYDLLYQVYCAKLTSEGADLGQEKQLRSFIKDSKIERQK